MKLTTISLIMAAMMLSGCLGRHHQLKQLGFENNFLSVNTIADGQHEKRIVYDGVAAKETYVTEKGHNRQLALWQVTDGIHFIQSIYYGHELQDCEYTNNADDISNFLKEFQDDEQKLQFLKLNPEVTMEMTNVSRRLLENEDAPEDMQRMLRLHLLRRECDERHEMIKSEHHMEDMDDMGMDEFVAGNQVSRSKRSTEEIFRVPNTQWCGRGFDAEEYGDVGGFVGTDRCCRDHDLSCPFFIEAWDTKYGLTNWLFYTLNHCNCDERFRTCLKRVDTGASNLVGKIFFNIAQTKCIVFKPEKTCVQSSWWGKCQKWVYKKKAVLRNPVPY